MDRIRRKSNDSEWKKAQELLGWLVCAPRPLKWSEMQAAVSINVEDETVDFEDRKLRWHIHDICGALVQNKGDRVSLVHHTARG